MRAAIFNPYLDSLGGGERYTMSFAGVLLKKGWDVDVEWKDTNIKEKLEARFGMDLKKINFIRDVKKGDGYDLIFWVSDGSVPLLRARKNLLHFQVPFHGVGGGSLLNRMKLIRINKIICNSQFTKNIIDKEYGVKSIVIYPPVAVSEIISKRKENLILSVGRFSQALQSKHQEILIKAFKKLYSFGLKGWRLVLAGGVEIGGPEYVRSLEVSTQGYPIEIIKSPNFKTIKDLYGRAKFFWTASGFGVDANKYPEKVEHFGITVVEAMGAKAVPMAYNAGGHKETITDGANGYLWEKIGDLVQKTKYLIDTPKLAHEITARGMAASTKYSEESFEKEVAKLL